MNNSRTPRSWLRERHVSEVRELDRRRQRTLSEASITWRELLHELFHPARFAWSALAVVWVVLLTLFVARVPAPISSPEDLPPSPALTAWVEQLRTYEAFAQIDRNP